MNQARRRAATWVVLLAAGAMLVCGPGCGGQEPAKPATSPARSTGKKQVEPSSAGQAPQPASAGKQPKRQFQPVQLGGSSYSTTLPRPGGNGVERHSDDVVSALQPFQVLLGQWRWVTKRKFGDFPKNGDDLRWVWDFQTEPRQPSLVCRVTNSAYFDALRLTWLPDQQVFQAQLTLADSRPRTLEGTWAEGGEPQDVSEGVKPQRNYKLLLVQTEPRDGEQWQLLLNQLDNDQYLVDLKRRAPNASHFASLDTVRQQRLGTSFALATSDNPGPKCIVSGGLGTSTVTYQGKSYPVCCSGCAAAFNDDPERWLSKLARSKEPAK